MAPAQFRKSLCLAAGYITLVEGILWEVFAVYSIGVYSCLWSFIGIDQGISTWNLLYISYFMGGCKSKLDAQSIGFNLTPPVDTARNLQVWMWIYAVFSAILILSCVMFIIAVTCEVRGSSGALLYYPWVCLTIALVLLDIAGAIYHLVDVFNTTTKDNFAQYIANMDWVSLTSASGDSTGVTSWLPSLYIVLLFCRLLVIWLLNIFFVHGVYKASIAVATHHKNSQPVPEKTQSWRDMFYQGPATEQVTTPAETGRRANMPPDLQQANSVKDELDVAAHEVHSPVTKEASYRMSEINRSPHSPGRSNQLFRIEPISPRRKDPPPPLERASSATSELNKFEPFSYIAGDQPQLMRRPVSRSNSHRDSQYPRIPERDYTIADRRSLEYVPNRFRVPSPKRATSQRQLIQQGDSPQLQARPLHSSGVVPQSPIPPQQRFYNQNSSQNDNYNINKLY